MRVNIQPRIVSRLRGVGGKEGGSRSDVERVVEKKARGGIQTYREDRREEGKGSHPDVYREGRGEEGKGVSRRI